jgi:hypothetical protein
MHQRMKDGMSWLIDSKDYMFISKNWSQKNYMEARKYGVYNILCWWSIDLN